MTSFIDTLTYPFRWVASYVMAVVSPDFFNQVVEESPLIARRAIEECISDLGMEYTQAQFLELLQQKLEELRRNRPQDHVVLKVRALISGFQARDEMWAHAYETAVLRRIEE
jgi:hypothetical protein